MEIKMAIPLQTGHFLYTELLRLSGSSFCHVIVPVTAPAISVVLLIFCPDVFIIVVQLCSRYIEIGAGCFFAEAAFI